MRALTLRQPWAWAVAYGGKTCENRTRRTTHRGEIAIHAGLTWDDDAATSPLITTLANWNRGNVPTGAVVALAEIVGCHEALGGALRCCYPWGEPGACHWELANVRPLATPVPCRGHLGLFNLPADVAAAVREQFEAVAR
jgi:hypothetical protein